MKLKLNKTIGTLALGLGFAVAANAQVETSPSTVAGQNAYTGTPIFFTGSTAFRQQIWNSLSDLGLTSADGALGSANNFTFYGNVSDITPGAQLGLSTNAPGLATSAVTVYCDFSGSAEGVLAIITPGSATYLNADNTATSFSFTGDDLAMSDVAQASTSESPAFTGVTLNEVQLNYDYTNHNGGGVGQGTPGTGCAVVTFALMGNAAATGAYAGTSVISNATSQNIQDLFDNGTLPLSAFTGNANDDNTNVIAVGRYPLSGTRYGTEYDYGIKPTAHLHQYALSTVATPGNTAANFPGLLSTDSTAPTGIEWATVASVAPFSGQGNGYFTGGNVGTAIHYSSVNSTVLKGGSASPVPALAYLGWPDAQSKITGTSGEGPISANGQNPYVGTYRSGNWNTNGVINGSYIFWTYEHMYVTPGDNTASFVTQEIGPGVIAGLEYEITHAAITTAVTEAQMNVYRNADGGDVFHY